MPKTAAHSKSAPAHLAAPADVPASKSFVTRVLLPRSGKERFLTAGLAVAALLLTLFAIPYTRYGLLGQVFKRSIVVSAVDSRTHRPVSDVTIKIGMQKALTDAKGQAKFAQVPVGGWDVLASKKYYNLVDSNLKVPLLGSPKPYQLQLVAIGNQVTVKVVNKITGHVLPKASIAVLGTTGTTDANGEAVIVLPTGKDTETGKVTLPGYNDLSVSVKNTETISQDNTFGVVPAGKVYFLSKRTGTINVMKSDLDGSNATVVITGTGHEDDRATVLLASRDWKYLALQARRDSDNPKLYIIDTSTDKMDVMDEGDKTEFSPVGWSGDYFIYTVNRDAVDYHAANRVAIKSFNAKTGNLSTLVQNRGAGTTYDFTTETIGNIALLNDLVVYTSDWAAQPPEYLAGKQLTVNTIKPSGDSASVAGGFDEGQNNYFSGFQVNSPDEVYYRLNIDNKTLFYEYKDGRVSATTDVISSDFDGKFYPTYLASPSNNLTFWYEPRDGANTIFAGDGNGDNSKQLVSGSEFTPYGWFTDDYILLSKNSSELYIAPRDLSFAPIKITDYHKPAITFQGYGGGYGGY